ncbi:protein jag [Acaricomes phytoseiuli]|uniref:Jag family protein n=1 Tax=Acaricomes phytoseiuli TaxID=291968 RepID=UPI000361060B|nr:R3H domain-containing nucleic acid-binding protein [Acaricomes phytoseiuli]
MTVHSSDNAESSLVEEQVEEQNDDASAPEETEDSGQQPSRMEEEGDVAADYLEELLDIVDIDGDIDIEVRNGRSYLSIVSEEVNDNLTSLVGADGEVLEALQELTRLNVLSVTGHRSRLLLDITGFRAERAKVLRIEGEEAVSRVKAEGEAVHLPPMNAHDRKIIHDVVAEQGLVSESKGEGSRRHVVVSAS